MVICSRAFSSSTNWALLSLKLLALLAAAFSTAVALVVSAPVIRDFTDSELPQLRDFALSSLRPPYLYFVLNCIVASSKLQIILDPDLAAALRVDYFAYDDGAVPDMAVNMLPEVDVVQEKRVPTTSCFPDLTPSNGGGISPMNPVSCGDFSGMSGGGGSEFPEIPINPVSYKDVFEINGDSEPPVLKLPEITQLNPASHNDLPQLNGGGVLSMMKSPAKPLVSTQFGHRKALKSSPEGWRALRVARGKR